MSTALQHSSAAGGLRDIETRPLGAEHCLAWRSVACAGRLAECGAHWSLQWSCSRSPTALSSRARHALDERWISGGRKSHRRTVDDEFRAVVAEEAKPNAPGLLERQ